MRNALADYVRAFDGLLRSARAADMRAAAAAPLAPALSAAPVCLVFSPHPDDEAIAGALPWRLRSQAGWRVINVAVTLGSNDARRAARWQEARACCDYLSFELCSASGETQFGMERIAPTTERSEPGHWAACVQKIAALLGQYQPRVIVCPHADDGHPAVDILRARGAIVRGVGIGDVTGRRAETLRDPIEQRDEHDVPEERSTEHERSDARPDEAIRALAFAGIVLTAINMFGGFAVTQRMLAMFRK